MLINPEKNANIKVFLNNLYSKITFLTYSLKQNHRNLDEFKWAISLNYILLKSLGNSPEFHNYLAQKLPDVYENYKYVAIANLKARCNKGVKQIPPPSKEVNFFENALINPFIFRINLYTMRTDVDLKILFSLFGGRFLPQKQRYSDGTGALYFSKEDFKSKSRNFESKLNILKDHLKFSGNDKNYCIALNKSRHWVAIDSIEKDYLLINDRAAIKWSITQNIPDNFRFYLFYYDLNEAVIFNKDFISFFESEIEKECGLMKNHGFL